MLSSRGGATTLLCVVLAVGGWALSMPELFAGGMALAAVILLSLLWVWFPANKPTLVASASPNPAHAATTVTITTTVTGRNVRPLLLTANISDGRSVRLWTRTGTWRKTPPFTTRSSGRKQSQTGSFPLPVPVRGRLSIGPFKVMIVDPLGLARRTLNATGKVDVNVRPRLHACEPVPLSSAASSRRLELEPSAARANASAGTEPAGLRSYVVGDELRLVHWTASARGRGLMVRTFDKEQATSSVILLDDRASTHTPESFELAVEVVTSMLCATSQSHSESHSAPMLIVWSDLVDSERHHGAGPSGSLVGGTDALDRLIDIEPTKLTRHTSSVMPSADVLVTGPFGARNDMIETNVGCLRLRVDPQLESTGKSVERPDQLEHWTDLAW